MRFIAGLFVGVSACLMIIGFFLPQEYLSLALEDEKFLTGIGVVGISIFLSYVLILEGILFPIVKTYSQ